jgi:hypothetical protein
MLIDKPESDLEGNPSQSDENKPVGGEPKSAIRTAVVMVHGMGEQQPLETVDRFVRTALPRVNGERRYLSRPEKISDSFEARRYLAYRQPFKPADSPDGPCEDTTEDLIYGQTEFLEYHWSYQMQGNRLSDLVPLLMRMLIRKPSTVPSGLKRIWLILWLLIFALIAAVILLWEVIDEWSAAGVILALGGSGFVAWAIGKTLTHFGSVVTKSFVDVVRYLDNSPRSYAIRRSIRQGMVDLLQSLHDKGRYSRVVVVAHSLGAYIAYDAITSLWPTMNKLHCGPITDDPDQAVPLDGVAELEELASKLIQHPVEGLDEEQQRELAEFREAQFEVWKNLRRQGNPWLITDFISVGTPMYMADLLLSKNRDEFHKLVKTAGIPQCPPRNGFDPVEGEVSEPGDYAWNNRGREVLTHSAPFAVVRWTNMFFRAENGWNGDWFGDALRPLFGNGIVDHPIQGNLPQRRSPGVAHGRYFSFPDDDDDDGIAKVLQRALALDIDGELAASCGAPGYLPETNVTR